jgi:putative transcriptional regulator
MDELFNILPKNKLNPEQGRILIAEPFIMDQDFTRSVILLTEHTEEGSVGFVLNKPLDLSIHDLIDNFPDFDGKIYHGGPVDTNHLYYLHTLGKKIAESKEIIKGLYWGGNFEQVKAKISSGELHNGNIRFFRGYSGWNSNQLKNEIELNSWYVADKKHIPLFNDDEGNTMWINVIKEMGKDFSILTNFPENPNLN